MKKLLMLLMVVTMLIPCALAEPTDYESVIAEKDEQIAALEAKIEELEAALNSNDSEPETYPTLEKGSKGNDVVALQTRLKELGYLDGAADGAYGNGTASAVNAFQAAAGLTETGIADAATQEALFADDAPKSLVYNTLDYKALARDPDAYNGSLIKFSGNILQVLEADDYVVFRIASKGNYDDVVYCTYMKPEGYKRFLEDDKVNVWAVSTGVYTYSSVMSGEITIPSCLIDRIELK